MRLNVCTRLDREASITISLPRDTTDAFNIRLEYKPVLSRFVGGYPSPYISGPQSQNNRKSLIAKEVAAIEAYLDLQGRDAKREPWLIPRPKRHRFSNFDSYLFLSSLRYSSSRAISCLVASWIYVSTHRGRPNRLCSMRTFLLPRYRLP